MIRIIPCLLLCTTVLFSFDAQALSPSREYKQLPSDSNLKYETITVNTADHVYLNAWYFPANQGDKIIIMSHDGVGNMGDYLSRVKMFHSFGFHVMAYDYRGYGSSTLFSIDPLNYVYPEFYTDFEAMVKYTFETYSYDIIAYGWGIGAGITINKGFSNDYVSGIIADEPFTDFERLKERFQTVNALMKIPADLMTSAYDNLETVTKTPGKRLMGVLYFHGNKNYLFGSEGVSSLLERTNLPGKALHLFKKSRRMDNYKHNESEYGRLVYAFTLNL